MIMSIKVIMEIPFGVSFVRKFLFYWKKSCPKRDRSLFKFISFGFIITQKSSVFARIKLNQY